MNMDTTSMMGLLDLVVLAAGAYLLYGWYQLMKKDIITQGLIASKSVDPARCKDLPAYKGYIGIRTLICAIAAIIHGLIGMYNDYVAMLPAPAFWITFAAFLVILIWFGLCCRKAEREYF